MGEWVSRYITMSIELFVVVLLALSAWVVAASVLDALFGWGVMDATRHVLDPVISDGSADPGDCDPNYGSC